MYWQDWGGKLVEESWIKLFTQKNLLSNLLINFQLHFSLHNIYYSLLQLNLITDNMPPINGSMG